MAAGASQPGVLASGVSAAPAWSSGVSASDTANLRAASTYSGASDVVQTDTHMAAGASQPGVLASGCSAAPAWSSGASVSDTANLPAAKPLSPPPGLIFCTGHAAGGDCRPHPGSGVVDGASPPVAAAAVATDASARQPVVISLPPPARKLSTKPPPPPLPPGLSDDIGAAQPDDTADHGQEHPEATAVGIQAAQSVAPGPLPAVPAPQPPLGPLSNRSPVTLDLGIGDAATYQQVLGILHAKPPPGPPPPAWFEKRRQAMLCVKAPPVPVKPPPGQPAQGPATSGASGAQKMVIVKAPPGRVSESPAIGCASGAQKMLSFKAPPGQPAQSSAAGGAASVEQQVSPVKAPPGQPARRLAAGWRYVEGLGEIFEC